MAAGAASESLPAGVVDQLVAPFSQRIGAARNAAAGLEVDDAYLRNAIDLLCGFILGAIVLAWYTVSPASRIFALRFAVAYAWVAEAEERGVRGQ